MQVWNSLQTLWAQLTNDQASSVTRGNAKANVTMWGHWKKHVTQRQASLLMLQTGS